MSFWEDFRKPFNLFSLFLAIAGIGVGVIFYFKGERKREIVYRNNFSTLKIYDKEKASPTIRIYDKDSLPISENVFLFTGTIWNNGSLPINKDDIRRPINIVLKNCSRILDFKILKEVDAAVSNFKLLQKKIMF